MEKYLFIDRDGTLINEPEDFQIDSLEKLEIEPYAVSSLKALKDAGFKLIMVSNQDGLGTKSFPKEDFEKPQNKMLQIFEAEGVTFDEILICPHFPHENCECRKPKLGLVNKYLTSGTVDFKNSYVIGDRPTDVELGKNMGVYPVQYNRKTNGWRKICESILNKPRTAHIVRNTKETQIDLSIDLDHLGNNHISTGIGFFDHMIDQIAIHGAININLQVTGDLNVDDHHTVEDVGIALGTAIKEALGDKRGIGRFGFVLAMDEVLAKIDGEPIKDDAEVALDISGRPYSLFTCEADFMREMVGEMATEMVPHFFRSLAYALGLTLHIKVGTGNTHHQVEAIFKGFGRAMRQALHKAGNELPSSKGVL